MFIQGPTQQIAHLLIHNSSYSIRTAPKHEETSFSALTYIHTKTAYRGEQSHSSNSYLSTRRGWMIEFMPWPLYPRRRTSVSCAGLCSRRIRFGRFGGEKSLAPTGIQTQDHPTRSLVTIPTADGVTLNEDRRRSDQKHVSSSTPQFRSVSKRITPVQCVGPTNKDVSRESASCIQMRIRTQADTRTSHTVIYNTVSLSMPYTQFKSRVLLFLLPLLAVLYA